MEIIAAQSQDFDALGNRVDPEVQYARGAILRSNEDETSRMLHGFSLIRSWVVNRGLDSVYNLNGIMRAHPITEEDLPNLGFFSSIAHLRGRAEETAVNFLGGEMPHYEGFIANRVRSANIAAMLALVKPGETVLCATADARVHPSVNLGIKLAGGTPIHSATVEDFQNDMRSNRNATTFVLTTVSPQLRLIPFQEARKMVDLARAHGLKIFVDDAHGALRTAAHKEPPVLKLEPDAAVISSDKHIYGPRSGVIAGKKATIERIRSISLQLGSEAETPTLAGVWHALRNHRTDHIDSALSIANEVFHRLQQQYRNRFYLIADGIGMTDVNMVQLVQEISGIKINLVPQEICSALSMLMLEKFGIVTVSAMAGPGAGPYFRAIAWPDGERLTASKMCESIEDAFSKLGKMANDKEGVRRLILGS
jgi:L-seryl-tRNA(Ser) seleniumtransferase